MTSIERHELRYQRRKAKRAEKLRIRNEKFGTFDKVYTYDHLYHSYRMCRKGVRWKASTQRYIANATLYVYNSYSQLKSGTFKSRGFYEFDLFERGKPRHIRSVDVHERVIQRCTCDYSLIPMLQPTFIYDNGASMKNKGYIYQSVQSWKSHTRGLAIYHTMISLDELIYNLFGTEVIA